MSDKRYQVFVSSTFRDLLDERREIVQALLEMDCIPTGMELFPAANDDAWTLIKHVIDQSDYYVLVIGGRYGTIDAEGISYTEREYDYAVKTERTALPFLHEDPGKIIGDKLEMDAAAQAKLAAFREKVRAAHHCKFWKNAEDLGSKVSRAMMQAIRTHPAVGWMRADEVAGPEMLAEINRLRLQVDSLTGELRTVRTEAPPGVERLLQGSDLVPLDFDCDAYTDNSLEKWKRGEPAYQSEFSVPIPLSWDQVFSVVGPLMLQEASEGAMKQAIERKIHQSFDESNWYSIHKGRDPKLADDDFQAIKVQLIALGLIRKSDRKRAVSDRWTYWTLSPYGDEYLMRLRALTKDQFQTDGEPQPMVEEGQIAGEPIPDSSSDSQD